jgi:hypothetical protein
MGASGVRISSMDEDEPPEHPYNARLSVAAVME